MVVGIEISSSAVVPRKNVIGCHLMTVDEVAAAAAAVGDMNVDADVGVAALGVGCGNGCIAEREGSGIEGQECDDGKADADAAADDADDTAADGNCDGNDDRGGGRKKKMAMVMVEIPGA